MWLFRKKEELNESLSIEHARLQSNYDRQHKAYMEIKRENDKLKNQLASYNLLAEEKKRAAMLYLQREEKQTLAYNGYADIRRYSPLRNINYQPPGWFSPDGKTFATQYASITFS